MAITFLNSTGLLITVGNQSTWSIPTHSSRLGGAAFVVGVGLASSVVTVSAMMDNAGNAYALAVRAVTPLPAAGAELWYATNISSASTRVSVTLSGNSSGSLGIGQFDGISTGGALDLTGSSAITANSTSHGASQITPSTTNMVVVSFARLTASTLGTITNLGGMTTWISTASAVRTHGMYIIQTTASTATGSFTTSSNAQHAAVIAAFSDTAAPVLFSGGSQLMLMGYGS
jgi:hypothetical protein